MSAICEFVVRAYPSYTRQEVLEALEIGADRLRGITGALNRIKPKGWDYRPHQRNFSYESFEVLKSYKTLVDSFGEVEAVKKINLVCERKFNA